MLISQSGTSCVTFPAESIPQAAFKISIAGGKRTIQCVSWPVNKGPDIAEQLYAITLKASTSVDRNAFWDSVPTGPKSMQSGPKIVHQDTRGASNGAWQSNATRVVQAQPQAFAYPALRDKFGLVANAAIDRYYDLVVHVVKVFPGPAPCELYVTDYTSNNMIYDYQFSDGGNGYRDGDTFGYSKPAKRDWPGPKMVIKVEAWPPHSFFADEQVKEGDFVKLSNVRVKLSRQGSMEANLWQDNIRPERIQIEKIQPGISTVGQALLERRDAYWNQANQVVEAAPKPMTKKERKRVNKQAETNGGGNRALKYDTGKKADGLNANKYVRCANDSINLSTISTILSTDRTIKHRLHGTQTLPFINQNRRAKVRVIDFYPHTIAEFTQLGIAEGADSSSKGFDTNMDALPGWIWDFFLLVEDAGPPPPSSRRMRPKLWLHVPHFHAEYLLKIDAVDLHANEHTLGLLREKLFFLWGNLEEIKSAASQSCHGSELANAGSDIDVWNGALSNVPFECCIAEYGQPIDNDDEDKKEEDWVQIFELQGTTIT